MSSRRRLRIVFTLGVFLTAANARGENWPQWRGAHLDGISNETGLPTEWGPKKNVLWRVELPGPAGATPVIWGERIFLTTPTGKYLEDLSLMCISTAGKTLWQRKITTGNQVVRGDEGNYASPSPSTDGKHVWTFMGNGALACYDVKGNKVWAFNVQERYGKLKIAFGMTSTPVLDRGRLYLQLIHGEGRPQTREAVVVALEAATGKEIWKHDRKSDARAECEHSYASPMLYRDKEREFLVTHGADYVVAHRLTDGGEIWRCGNLNPKSDYNPTLRFVASPLAVPGMIVVPSAKGRSLIALRPNIKGDVTENDNARHWTLPRNTPDVSSPLVKDGLVYLCRENGNLMCLDAKSGERLYEERTQRDRHRASPVYVDGKILLTARRGHISVLRPGRKFQLLATNTMGESMSASPAVSGGRIYLRTFKALYAVGKK